MADEIPPAPSESDDASKAETIRITLPPKQEQQAVKRETVRINLPGKPASVPPMGIAPKKETTKLGGGITPAPVSSIEMSETAPISRLSVPPPPKPPAAPSAPSVPPPPSGIASKPIGGGAPPKPPTMGARPTVPLKPAPAPAPTGVGGGPTPAPMPSPVAQKAAAPKKETARITLPPEGGAKPALPKATVKMQQTQPLVNRPAASLTPAAAVTTAALPVNAAGSAAPDGLANIMGIAAAVVSIISLALVWMAYSAASLQ